MSNFPCSLTRNIASHSMENLAFHSLLRWKMIMLLQLSLIRFSLEGWPGRMYSFWTWEKIRVLHSAQKTLLTSYQSLQSLYTKLPLHSQEWSISNFLCSLTRNFTSHSMENLAFHSLLRWKMITLPVLASERVNRGRAIVFGHRTTTETVRSPLRPVAHANWKIVCDEFNLYFRILRLRPREDSCICAWSFSCGIGTHASASCARSCRVCVSAMSCETVLSDNCNSFSFKETGLLEKHDILLLVYANICSVW